MPETIDRAPVSSVPPQTQSQPVPKQLAAKLAAIMGELHRVPKNGTNEFHHYRYVTESDLADALRAQLAAHKVVILPSVLSWDRETIPTSRGQQYLVNVWMSFSVIDAESGEIWVSVVPGHASDSLDKAIYKAMTGAQKYMQLKTFLVSSGDDPEEDGESERQPARAAKAAPAKAQRAQHENRGHGQERFPAIERKADGGQTVEGVLTKVERKTSKIGNAFLSLSMNGITLFCFDEMLMGQLRDRAGQTVRLEYEENERDGKIYRTVVDVEESGEQGSVEL